MLSPRKRGGKRGDLYKTQIIQIKGLRRASLTHVVLTEVEVKNESNTPRQNVLSRPGVFRVTRPRSCSGDQPTKHTSSYAARKGIWYPSTLVAPRVDSTDSLLPPNDAGKAIIAKMASSNAVVPLLVSMMLLTGVCNTLLTKYQV